MLIYWEEKEKEGLNPSLICGTKTYGLFGSLEREESRGEWFPSTLFRCF